MTSAEQGYGVPPSGTHREHHQEQATAGPCLAAAPTIPPEGRPSVALTFRHVLLFVDGQSSNLRGQVNVGSEGPNSALSPLVVSPGKWAPPQERTGERTTQRCRCFAAAATHTGANRATQGQRPQGGCPTRRGGVQTASRMTHASINVSRAYVQRKHPRPRASECSVDNVWRIQCAQLPAIAWPLR